MLRTPPIIPPRPPWAGAEAAAAPLPPPAELDETLVTVWLDWALPDAAPALAADAPTVLGPAPGKAPAALAAPAEAPAAVRSNSVVGVRGEKDLRDKIVLGAQHYLEAGRGSR